MGASSVRKPPGALKRIYTHVRILIWVMVTLVYAYVKIYMNILMCMEGFVHGDVYLSKKKQISF